MDVSMASVRRRRSGQPELFPLYDVSSIRWGGLCVTRMSEHRGMRLQASARNFEYQAGPAGRYVKLTLQHGAWSLKCNIAVVILDEESQRAAIEPPGDVGRRLNGARRRLEVRHALLLCFFKNLYGFLLRIGRFL